jgi:phosphoribosylamine-glycine ligase
MLGAGLVEKSKSLDYLPTMISDSSGYGMTLDAYKAQGGRTFGGSQIADRMENDRQYASSIFKQAKIKEPASEEFESWGEAEEFVNTDGKEARLVFKPCGEFSGNLPSYVSKDHEDLLESFARFKKIVGDKEPQFVLQEFIEGTCISSEVFFAKNEPCRPCTHTLESKTLMVGGIGPSGGCTGNVVWRCDESDCPLCANLEKLEGFLREVQWCGPLDINTVVSKEGEIYALEFTPRFGYDAMPTLLYGLWQGNFGAFIDSCCRGEAPEMPLLSGFAAGIRVSIPPWPSKQGHAEAGIAIPKLSMKHLVERFYPYEVGLAGDSIVTSGGGGIIGVSVAYSEDIEQAFHDAEKFCKKLEIPDGQWRVDFGEVFTKELSAVRRAFTAKVKA